MVLWLMREMGQLCWSVSKRAVRCPLRKPCWICSLWDPLGARVVMECSYGNAHILQPYPRTIGGEGWLFNRECTSKSKMARPHGSVRQFPASTLNRRTQQNSGCCESMSRPNRTHRMAEPQLCGTGHSIQPSKTLSWIFPARPAIPIVKPFALVLPLQSILGTLVVHKQYWFEICWMVLYMALWNLRMARLAFNKAYSPSYISIMLKLFPPLKSGVLGHSCLAEIIHGPYPPVLSNMTMGKPL